MQMLDVRIQRKDDPPVFEEFAKDGTPRQVGFGPIAVLENGTLGGQIAIVFYIPDESGKPVFAQMTENILYNLSGIVRGLRKRIDEEKAKQT